jgi:RNA-directed DNA polymerase
MTERRGHGTRRGGPASGWYPTRWSDVEAFDHILMKCMQPFGLRLAPEKTRIGAFGRCARERAAAHGGQPGPCEFLGLTHVCGIEAQGRLAVVRIPSEKSCRKFLAHTSEWLHRHQHWRRRDQQRHLTLQLKGFYQYLALHRGVPKLKRVKYHVEKQGRHTIKRQSQRHRVFWSSLRSRAWRGLPHPKVLHPGV